MCKNTSQCEVNPEQLITSFKVRDNSLHVNKVDIGWHLCVSLHGYWPKSVRIF